MSSPKVHQVMNENVDVEAATSKRQVVGIVLGVDRNNEENPNESQPPAPVLKRKNDPLIFFLSFLYVFSVVALFVWPWLNAQRPTMDGFEEIATGILIIFIAGGAALVIATVTLLTTVCRWTRLPTASKLVGVFPVMSSMGVILILLFVVKFDDDEEDVVECTFPNGTAFNSTIFRCPTLKNTTNATFDYEG